MSRGTAELEQAVLEAVAATRGHFRYESGHHGDLWLDLDALFVEAKRTRDWALAMARLVATCQPEVICGPLTGGAFFGQLLAAEAGADFVFSERLVSATGLVRYRVPQSLRPVLAGRRVLLVDDAINAGSALRSTLTDLLDSGIELAGLASLLVLGEAALQIAKQHEVPFFTLAMLERGMWTSESCPLCRAGVPLIDRLERS